MASRKRNNGSTTVLSRVCVVKPQRGRPPTERGAYNALPGRKFGRVSDADWQEIRDACEMSGLSLVEWALPMMLSRARREKKNRAK